MYSPSEEVLVSHDTVSRPFASDRSRFKKTAGVAFAQVPSLKMCTGCMRGSNTRITGDTVQKLSPPAVWCPSRGLGSSTGRRSLRHHNLKTDKYWHYKSKETCATDRDAKVVLLNNNKRTWSATYTLISKDIGCPGQLVSGKGCSLSPAIRGMNFEVAFEDLVGQPGRPVVATTDKKPLSVDTVLPRMASVSMKSSNSNVTRTKIGDTITFTLAATEDLMKCAVYYTLTGGNKAKACKRTYRMVMKMNSKDRRMWTATHKLGATRWSGSCSGHIASTFRIDTMDMAGNRGLPVTSTSDGTHIWTDNIAPTLRSVSLFTDNADKTRVTVGDMVILTIVADEDLMNMKVYMMLGRGACTNVRNASVSVRAGTKDRQLWTVSYRVVDADNGCEGQFVGFKIMFDDLVGNHAVPVTATTDKTRVAVVHAVCPYGIGGAANPAAFDHLYCVCPNGGQDMLGRDLITNGTQVRIRYSCQRIQSP